MDSSLTPPVSKKAFWIGHVLSTLPALLLIFSAVMKLMGPPEVVKGFADLGWPDGSAFGIGFVELVAALLYLIPRTAIFGAILVTGYLGGAIATNVRVSAPWGGVLSIVIMGVMIWGGLFLRDRRLRALLPLRS